MMHRAALGFGERPNAAFSDYRGAALIAGSRELHDNLADIAKALGMKSAQ